MFLKLLFRQAIYKWGINLLIFLALSTLVTLYVYMQNTTRFANRSMQLIMKNMGHNLLILPDETNPLDTYLCNNQQILFSDQVTRELAKHTHLASRYYVSTLQQKIHLENHEFILTGIEPVPRKDETREKQNMIQPIQKDRARIGSMVAKQLQLAEGSEITINKHSFKIAEILPAKGEMDDYRIYINLSDCQTLLDQAGKINVIMAFACLHVGNQEETEAFQKKELAKIQPGFKQITQTDIFQGRYWARMTTQTSLQYILMIVLGVVILLIVVTGFQEVTERRRELGIFVSMGANYFYIIGLYLVKILFLAFAASLSGFLIGSLLSMWFNTSILISNTMPVRILWEHYPNVAYRTCLIAVIAELIPMLKLLRMDPAATLIEE